ncbi:MAG: PD-(D/E)XK nuclease family protein [candidate division WOR-3 bacterium]
MGKFLIIPFYENFIKCLGDYLYEENNNDLSSLCVVFPGIRPSHFLLDYLKRKIKKAFLPPTRFSIEEWMQYLFSLKREEKIPGEFDLIYLLYKAIIESSIEERNPLIKMTRSISNYIYWGRSLLNALEEMEIQKVSEKEIKPLATYEESFLDWAKEFWKYFKIIKSNFYKLLRNNNLTFRGEVFRWVSENIETLSELIPFKKVIFAGFYAITKSEEEMMKFLFLQNKADIIIQSEEIKEEIPISSPSYFHSKWIKAWGINPIELKNERKKEPEIFFHKCFDTHTEVMAACEIFSNFKGKDKNVAIVLPNSNSLIPLISELVQPSSSIFNITMGYPLKRTALFALLKIVFSLQKTKKKEKGENLYYIKDYLNLIQHPWIKTIISKNGEEVLSVLINYLKNKLTIENREKLKNFFTLEEIKNLIVFEEVKKYLDDESKIKETMADLEKIHFLSIEAFSNIYSVKEISINLLNLISFLYIRSSIKKHPLNDQYIGTLYEKLNEIKNSIFSEINFKNSYDATTFFENYLLPLKIPFKGEPLKGVQIMGMLETRNLNFDQIIILDVNEGILPEVNKYDPILPPGFRKIVGLPDYRESESIYAHNFFRLIAWGKEVHLIYKEGKLRDVDRNIKSRFIEKLVWEKEKEKKTINHFNRIFKLHPLETKKIRNIEKNEKILKKLKNIEYSPTNVDVYLRCPLQFYYRFILELEEALEVEEEIEKNVIGKFIHSFLREYYTKFLGQKLSLNAKDFITNLEQKIKGTFKEGGGQILLGDIIKSTLKKFLEYEIERSTLSNIYIRELEKKIKGNLNLKGETFRLEGRIDRVEEIEDRLYIIDYKTGESKKIKRLKENELIENMKDIRKNIESFQLPIYVYLYSKFSKIPIEKIQAKILNIRKPREEILFFSEDMNFYLKALQITLCEITNPKIPFYPVPQEHCNFCPYKLICSEGS